MQFLTDLEQRIAERAQQQWQTDEPVELTLDAPKDESHGDYAISAALRYAKSLGKPPIELAQSLADAIADLPEVAQVTVAMPGFINIVLADEVYLRVLRDWNPVGVSRAQRKRRIVLDSSHPNIAKPLHFGNLRTTLIGEVLARILRDVGHEVLQDNFLGDWGTQFGKLVVAIQKWGNPDQVLEMTIDDMVELYRRFNAEAEANPELNAEGAEAFRKLEVDKDPEIFALWQGIVRASLNELQLTYDRLDIHFDIPPGDRGEYHWTQYQDETIEKLESTGVAKIDDGALVVEFDEALKLPNMLYRKSDGATLYQTRDVTRILWYAQEGYNDHVYVVGADQGLHFRQVFATARMLGVGEDVSLTHVPFGLLKMPDGSKMSTRKGTVVDVEDVIDQSVEKATDIVREQNPSLTENEVATAGEQIGIGALKFQNIALQLHKDITFDWDEVLRFEGYSGPSIMYAAVRANTLLSKADSLPTADTLLQLTEPEEREIITRLVHYAAAVERAAAEYAPHHIAHALYDLGSALNRLYAHHRVLQEEDETRRHTRLVILQQAAATLTHGLYLLGIEVPERM